MHGAMMRPPQISANLKRSPTHSCSTVTVSSITDIHPISCGPIEGINNKIKTLKRQAYGFRDMVYFKLRLYHLHSQAYSLTG
ncbi:MAG: transposase [Deltaproteobacteria bacterium]|nr:transposase [Deltaproteobacteria bacterium]